MKPNGSAGRAGVQGSMAFIRTVMIIAALLLGWFALRAESSAHSMPAPTVELQPAS